MLELSIGQLEEMTGGRLQLASLPPRGGRWEPINDIAVHSAEAGPGTVVWDLADATPRPGRTAPLHAMLQSALGVVTHDRHVIPWAGAFALHLPDPLTSLCHFIRQSCQQYFGHTIGLTAAADTDMTAQLIRIVLATRYTGGHCDLRCGSVADQLGTLVRWPHAADYTIVLGIAQAKITQIQNSVLCCPGIVAITGSHISGQRTSLRRHWATLSRVLNQMPHNATLIMNADDPVVRWAASETDAAVSWVGSSQHAKLAARCVSDRPFAVDIEIDGQTVHVQRSNQWPTISILTALVVGLHMGIAPAAAATALAAVNRAAVAIAAA